MGNSRIWFFAAILAAGTSAFGQNILQNPGFETGTLDHWSTNGPVVASSIAHSGQFSAYAPGDWYIEQDFAAIPDANIKQVSYWIKQNFRSPYFNAFMFFYSDGTNQYFLPGGVNSGGWGFVDVTSELAVGKSLIGIRTYGATTIGGVNPNTYFDDFFVGNPAAVPEPTSWLMLGLPLGLMTLRRRR